MVGLHFFTNFQTVWPRPHPGCFFFEFEKALCQTAATTTASKCQHSTFPHIHELPKAQKTGMPLPNRNSSVSRCSEAIRPCGSLTQPSQSAAVLPKSYWSETTVWCERLLNDDLDLTWDRLQYTGFGSCALIHEHAGGLMCNVL